ncbi:MAG: SufD family Fe-S cluster assembly protein [Methanomicrobiales archaeon]|nr:SufD family Fe-S cluster assembly protein [Methanomicrobiales archaeon]
MQKDISGTEGIRPEDRARLAEAGLELDALNRCGSFFQIDQKIVHTSCMEEGIEMYPIAEALRRFSWMGEYAWNLVSRDKDDITRYVAAQEEPKGYVIIARKGSRNVMPLQACLFLEHVPIQHVHNIIIAEEGAELHLITGCASSHRTDIGAHYGVTEFYVGKNARITTTMIHKWGEQIDVFPRSAARVEEGGTFLSNYIAMSPVKHVQMYPVADLAGRGAVARFHSIVVAPAGSHLDLGSRVLLSAPETNAEIISRSITRGGTVIARSHIRGGTEETRGHIECKGLILEDGIIHAIPEIEGRVTGTELSHEAAVGKIARDEIEYLMARGLDEEEATATIIRGFLDVRIAGLPAVLQKQIDAAIDAAEQGF